MSCPLFFFFFPLEKIYINHIWSSMLSRRSNHEKDISHIQPIAKSLKKDQDESYKSHSNLYQTKSDLYQLISQLQTDQQTLQVNQTSKSLKLLNEIKDLKKRLVQQTESIDCLKQRIHHLKGEMDSILDHRSDFTYFWWLKEEIKNVGGIKVWWFCFEKTWTDAFCYNFFFFLVQTFTPLPTALVDAPPIHVIHIVTTLAPKLTITPTDITKPISQERFNFEKVHQISWFTNCLSNYFKITNPFIRLVSMNLSLREIYGSLFLTHIHTYTPTPIHTFCFRLQYQPA